MLLHDVVNVPDLGIRVLHGDTDALARPVLRACTTDMPDPTRYVTAESLVFTGLVWRRSAEDTDLFVKRLVAAGVAAMAAGEALHGGVPDDVVDACVRHRLPLLAVPDHVPFSRVIEHMTGRMAGARMDRLQTGLARQRQWLSAVADGRPVEELLDRLAQQFGVQTWLITATGVTVTSTPLPDDAVLDGITATALTASRFPAATPDGFTILPVGRGLVDRLDSWFLVIRNRDVRTEVGSECVEAFGELATVVAFDRVRRDERRRAAWEIAEHSALAVPVGERVAVVAESEGHIPTDMLRALVEDVLGPCVTSVDTSGRVVALTGGTEETIAALLRRRLGRLTPALRHDRVFVGVSDRCTGDNVDGGVRAATAAAAAARNLPDTVSVRRSELDSALGLMSTLPADLLRSYADRILGEVIEHDRCTDARLLETLEVFLECDGSWRRAADRLHVHLNTVRYRIGRVEALTGRDLGRTGDRLDVYFALRSRGDCHTAPV
ncbi:DNA-binding PucR family transcriptional regulator [Rhodococcus sp. SMB37]|uniref:helix-turn-helix domain-containing protein n=1 Tax=Rhodococcus sp. SMB37 TaxID=2512213 RepID=UPI00104DFB54|nr:PucR family transcriptional regulator [Rhodococcus sp. SMB37]TCN55007.1 DNA-binding PucR family transcriptional regulator [Rhodococcus sp. SMB37]